MFFMVVRLCLAIVLVSGAPTAVQDALRPVFHFQPVKNWMNDPNGPVLYEGVYHLFFQYNPYAAVPRNISWGHAISKDLINWDFLDLALRPDQTYDRNGAFSGSITFVEDVPIILYTGSAANLDQSQNQAVPANMSDLLLRKWKKIPQNPIIFPPPPGVGTRDFRDPTSAWIGSDKLWRILVGAKKNTTGLALLYKSKDFVNWDLVDHPLNSVAGTGMWECPDFYPVLSRGTRGLNDSARGPGISHVLKVSLDDTRLDAYAVGTYDAKADKFTANVPELDTGIGRVYDHGVFYASKTFYDSQKQRRVLWGWVTEKDSVEADIAKGWAGLQALPRVVWLDETNTNGIRQWPIEEVRKLRRENIYKRTNLKLGRHSNLAVNEVRGSELDMEVTFNIMERKLVPLNGTIEDAKLYCLDHSLINMDIVGPFGLMVLASDDFQEYTSIYFLLLNTGRGWKPLFCTDIRRSSLQPNVTKTVYGGFVNVTSSEELLSMRIIVDHSVVEAFAQGGRTCITSRVYPTAAINDSARLSLFNHGNGVIEVERISVWKMQSAKFQTLEEINPL